MAETIGQAVVRIYASGRGFDKSVESVVEKSGPTFEKVGRRMGDRFSSGFFDEFAAAAKKVSAREMNLDLASLEKSFKRLERSNFDFAKSVKSTTGAMGGLRTGLERMKTSWAENREETDRFGDSMGRLFGKGSRNDFVNIVGSITGALTKLSGRFVSLLESLPGLNRIFGSGGVLPGFVTTIPALVAGLAAVTLGLGLMTAAASGLLGILTALISVGFFGLVGAAGAAAGALVPLTVGIGTLILAITHLSDAQKNKLEPVGDAFGDLGDAAAESFGPHLVKNVDGFVRVLEGLEPVVRDVGDAMGRVLDDFMQDLESPAWERFGRQVGRFLPDAVESLGTSFSNALGGMAGVFRGMIPLVERFLGWLEDVTGEFNEWANSAAGQRQLREFFDKAGDSAAALGEFLGAATEALFKLLDSGNERGIDILDRMTAKVQEFSDWITSAEGQKALEDWFQQAEDLAVSLGHLAEDLIAFFDQLDSPENRKALNDFVELTGDLVGIFEAMAGPLQTMLGPLLFLVGAFVELNKQFEKITGGKFDLLDVLNPVGAILGEIASALGKIDFGKITRGLGNIKLPDVDLKDIFKFPPISYFTSQFRNAASAIGKAFGKFSIKDIFNIPPISYIANQFKNAASAVGKAIGKFDIKDIFNIPAISWIADKFKNGAEAVGKAIGKFNLMNIFNIPSLSDIAAKFSGLDEAIENAIGSINIDWPDPPGWVNRLPLIGGAAGGILAGPTHLLAGEAGPEALVPLARPLNLVDPAVRALSAIAQGITPPPTSMASGGVVGQRPVELTVITPTEDPFAVASEVVNRLAVVGY